MSIQLLDCTLRDGGYVNDWQFSDKESVEIVCALEKANIDVIECGYLNDQKGKQNNSTQFPDTQIINGRLGVCDDHHAVLVAMINIGDYDIAQLLPKKETLLDGIRLAFHKEDLSQALESASYIKQLGYRLYFQPMVTKRYGRIEFLEMIEQVNMLEPHAFYIVDSFGSMMPDDFACYFTLADSHLKETIQLGYHAHNNMQLAFSNAVHMIENRGARDIVIDASIYGVGRGAGNLNTELIAAYLNQHSERKYTILPLLEMIDDFFEAMMQKSPWGFTPAQFLSAAMECHPNYTTFLVNKNTNSIVEINRILEKIPEKKRVSFDQNLIESLYMRALLEIKTAPHGEMKLDGDKKILLIASGQSIAHNREMLEVKVQSGKYAVIGLNHIPSFECDYYFFSNQKRYDEFALTVDPKKLVVTSNIRATQHISCVLDFEKFVFVEDFFISNAAVIMLNYLISRQYDVVELAGLDGYHIQYEENYSYDETNAILDPKAIKEQNRLIGKSIAVLAKKIFLKFLTPSLFQPKQVGRILGVIPARYSSSRFEGKPLCLINNIPMIKRTYEQARKSEQLSDLVVATDDKRIYVYCQEEGIPVMMTSTNCLTGTDRLAEVAQKKHFDLYINIQGDEPVIDPRSIDEIVSEFRLYGDRYIAYNLYKYIQDTEEIYSDTIIKVITNEKDELMYMSRLPVPFNKKGTGTLHKKQVCVYGFTPKALEVFASRKEKTLNEQYEDIEILRFVDMGYPVKMKETKVDSIAVDVPADIEKVERFLEKNGKV
jgi:3-deoxy-D-manno-octulosonate cytidylyltransferase